MAKKKATVGRTKRAKASKKKAGKKKTALKRGKRVVKKVAKKKVATKKVARKPARKKVVKKAVKRAAKPAKAKRAVKVVVARPKRPRRTKQALPPRMTGAVTPIIEVEPLAPVAAAPAPREAQPVPSAAGPAVGDFAPYFELPDETGCLHNLAQYRGKKVVLYFYPKDDTPGCTTEACGFRNSLGAFTDRGAVVLGVSPDAVDSHERFAQKYSLTFPLLADTDHRVAEAYGVWVEKERMGEKVMGIARTTFLIDTDGRISHIFHDVRPDGHEQEVLQHL
jgi:peroxiredoxin Q/BCP